MDPQAYFWRSTRSFLDEKLLNWIGTMDHLSASQSLIIFHP